MVEDLAQRDMTDFNIGELFLPEWFQAVYIKRKKGQELEEILKNYKYLKRPVTQVACMHNKENPDKITQVNLKSYIFLGGQLLIGQCNHCNQIFYHYHKTLEEWMREIQTELPEETQDLL